MQSISISKWMVDLQNTLSNYSNILVLSSKSFRERGQLNILETSLPGKNLFILDNINSLPTIHEIDSHYALLKKLPFKFEIIVALGGGSVIDSSKCIAYLLASNTQLSLARVIESAKTDTNTYALPIIAIPTTAGTGSEATSFATVWDSDLKVKKSLENISIKPLIYIHDFNLLLPKC
jgi:alcohol dehydrogenase class IV